MDTKTGRIEVVADEADARRRGLIPIPAEELERVQQMTPAERQAWAAERLMNRKQRRAKRAEERREKRRKR